MTPQEHYVEAERLLEEGVETVRQLSIVAEVRDQTQYGTVGYTPDRYQRQTQRMDELGKKCQGIWAQAQVHATLSLGPGEPYVPATLTEAPF